MKKVNVFVSGVTGRMGKRIVEAVNQHPNWKVCGGFGLGEHQYHFPVWEGGNCLPSSMFATKKPDVIIDFSTPVLSNFVYYNFACYYGVPMVCATTKLPADLIEHMKKQIVVPVFQAYNMAYDVYVFTQAVANLVAKLPKCHIDIIEVHHIGKKDAPSGTALNLAEAINRALGDTHSIIFNPSLDVPRVANEIHIHSRRSGSVAGKHTVELRSSDEYVITLEHEAISPKIFASGAIKAAEFLLEQKPGYYNMDSLA